MLWLHALLVLCAYSAFKSIDDFSLFAVQAYGMDEVEGARVNVLAAWLRPPAALGAGLLADRLAPTRVAQLCFVVLIASHAALACTGPGVATLPLFWIAVVGTVAAAFGLRGVYFAILQELRVPAALTGAAVGLVSVVGFAPDVFLGPVTGWLLDRSRGRWGTGTCSCCSRCCRRSGCSRAWRSGGLRGRAHAPELAAYRRGRRVPSWLSRHDRLRSQCPWNSRSGS
jgi:nitrate/nitrite transporter NarK